MIRSFILWNLKWLTLLLLWLLDSISQINDREKTWKNRRGSTFHCQDSLELVKSALVAKIWAKQPPKSLDWDKSTWLLSHQALSFCFCCHIENSWRSTLHQVLLVAYSVYGRKKTKRASNADLLKCRNIILHKM